MSEEIRLTGEGDHAFRRISQKAVEDADRIIGLISHSEDLARADRRFFSVLIDETISALRLYRTVRAGGSEERTAEVLTKISRALGAVSVAREAMELALMDSGASALDVLCEAAPEPSQAATPANGLTDQLTAGLSGLGGRVRGFRGVGSVGATEIGGMFRGIGASASARASGAVGLTGSLVSEAAEIASGAVIDPITKRAQAASTAAGSAIVNGGIAGIALGIPCPPLLPLTGGVAALAAVSAYNSEMAHLDGVIGAEREARVREIRAKRKQAVAAITSGESALRSETKAVSLVVDGDSGAADALIKGGPHSDRAWSTLTANERRDEERRNRGDCETLGILTMLADIAVVSALS